MFLGSRTRDGFNISGVADPKALQYFKDFNATATCAKSIISSISLALKPASLRAVLHE